MAVDAHELHEKTGGNPFFVTEVLGAPSERIPETVRDAVLARAERLPEPARRLLQALAVVPGRVELWLLSALAGEPADRLEQCLASGVLTVVDGGVAYRHELAREAVETTLPPDRRLALHRAALTALSAPAVGDPDPTRLSHHAEAVGDAEAVLVWAPQAAVRAAGAGAHREAAAQYARALRFSDRLTAEARADLLERRAHECFLVNESAETIASLQQAIELESFARRSVAGGSAAVLAGASASRVRARLGGDGAGPGGGRAVGAARRKSGAGSRLRDARSVLHADR